MEEIYLNSLSFCYDPEKFIWMYDPLLRQLFKANTETGRSQLINTYCHQDVLIWNVKKWNNYVLLIPAHVCDTIFCIDRHTLQVTEKKIPKLNMYVISSIVYGNKIYFISRKALRQIVCLDLVTNKIEHISFLQDFADKDEEYVQELTIENDKLIIPVINSCFVYYLDLTTNDINKLKCKGLIKACAVISDGVYILSIEGVFYYSLQQSRQSETEILIAEPSVDIDNISTLIYCNRKLFLMPRYGVGITIIDVVKKNIEVFYADEYDIRYYSKSDWNYMTYECTDDNLYFGTQKTAFLRYNIKSDKIIPLNIMFPKDYSYNVIMNQLMNNYLVINGSVLEDNMLSLQNLVEYINNDESM